MIRWLFSTVSVSMLWDDHDMSDDWNISYSWLEEMRRRSWWHRRAVDCITSYWIYQHLGNLSPDELDDSEVYRRGPRQPAGLARCSAPGPTESTSTHPARAGASTGTSAAPGPIFIDSRAGRVLEADSRAIVDEEEWDWIVEHCSGDFDHLLLATTVPFLLSPAFDRLEAWNERLCDGAWGSLIARGSELLRREVDFDHWAAFQDSFAQMRDLLAEVGERASTARRRSRSSSSPATSTTPTSASSGCPAAARTAARSTRPSARLTATRSTRRSGGSCERRSAARSRALCSGLAKLAGAPDPGCRWRLLEGPCFDNQVSTLTLDGDAARPCASIARNPAPTRPRAWSTRSSIA